SATAANVTIEHFQIDTPNTALHLAGASNAVVYDMNLSYSGQTQSGIGLLVDGTADNVQVQYCAAINRNTGIVFNGGSDAQILNNDLPDSGGYYSAALVLANLTANQLTGGVLVNGNTFAGNNCLSAVQIVNMSGLTISDGSINGTNVALTGLNNASST